MAGSKLTTVDGNTTSGHLEEMIPPSSSWGKTFVTVPFAGRVRGDVFRIIGRLSASNLNNFLAGYILLAFAIVSCDVQTPSDQVGWAQWQIQGDCSVTCGYGRQRAVRDCSNPPTVEASNDCKKDSWTYKICKVNRSCVWIDYQKLQGYLVEHLVDSREESIVIVVAALSIVVSLVTVFAYYTRARYVKETVIFTSTSREEFDTYIARLIRFLRGGITSLDEQVDVSNGLPEDMEEQMNSILASGGPKELMQATQLYTASSNYAKHAPKTPEGLPVRLPKRSLQVVTRATQTRSAFYRTHGDMTDVKNNENETLSDDDPCAINLAKADECVNHHYKGETYISYAEVDKCPITCAGQGDNVIIDDQRLCLLQVPRRQCKITKNAAITVSGIPVNRDIRRGSIENDSKASEYKEATRDRPAELAASESMSRASSPVADDEVSNSTEVISAKKELCTNINKEDIDSSCSNLTYTRDYSTRRVADPPETETEAVRNPDGENENDANIKNGANENIAENKTTGKKSSRAKHKNGQCHTENVKEENSAAMDAGKSQNIAVLKRDESKDAKRKSKEIIKRRKSGHRKAMATAKKEKSDRIATEKLKDESTCDTDKEKENDLQALGSQLNVENALENDVSGNLSEEEKKSTKSVVRIDERSPVVIYYCAESSVSAGTIQEKLYNESVA